MSKIRIYELAKELGVDNKVVIARANELGFTGKLSHSNSLDADEADQIRRAIIRQALGGTAPARPQSQEPQSQEVVTTRVDKNTGQTEAVVERRHGNVIRRRRQPNAADDAVVDSSGVDSSGADGPDDGRAAGVAQYVEEELHARVGVEVQPEQSEEFIEQAEQVEYEADAAENVDAEPEIEEETNVSEPEETEEVVEHAVNGNVTTEDITAGVEPVTEGKVVEAKVAETKTPEVLKSPEAKAPIASRTVVPERPLQLRTAQTRAVQHTTIVAPESTKPVGPKILGKIELPVKKVLAKVEPAKRPFGAPAPTTPEVTEEEEGKKKTAAKKKGRKREVTSFDLVDYGGRDSRRSGGDRGSARGFGRHGSMDRNSQPSQEVAKAKASKRVVRIDELITVGELAKQLSIKAGEVISKLLELGVMATINQALDRETATIVAEDFDFSVESVAFNESAILEDVKEEESGNRKGRPPIVTVMGHVDHGKTSLLDAIRSASVAAREHGGITQHIGAYSVKMEGDRSVTFIDTPGHEAFTAMRARGAQVTDIVILVVAADDGVMPQTREAINHAQAAKVPIVVAVNKMDRPDANPDRIKQQLAEFGLQPEDWGGDTMFFPVSALKRTGLKELLEGVLLTAEIAELTANPDARARGAVIEAKQDRGRGSVATVIILSGTLKVGEVFVCGSDFGRVRSMTDSSGERIDIVTPATAVEITGFNTLPMAGDDFFVVESDAQARAVATSRQDKKKAKEERSLLTGPISLEDFARRANNMAILELNVILKADVQGSVEAAKNSVERLSGDKVKVRVLHGAVGGVNESDVQLAIASRALIVGFGVRAEPRAMADAERAGVEIRFYRVIYELVDDVKAAMVGLLPPIKQEVPLGRVEVREVFNAPKVGTIAGCYVTTGVVKRGSFARLLRDSRVIFEGKMGSLRRFKDDVREVSSGYECGVSIEGYNDIKLGDVIEVFEYKEVAPTLE